MNILIFQDLIILIILIDDFKKEYNFSADLGKLSIPCCLCLLSNFEVEINFCFVSTMLALVLCLS